MERLQQVTAAVSFRPEEITQRIAGIYDAVLANSRYLDQGNFTQIHPDDLAYLFELYDGQFFAGSLREALASCPLRFRLSRRMISAGGKTGRLQRRRRNGHVEETRYEIVISTTLLFQTFQNEPRAIRVTGRECRDRLEALQRVFEHELVHLAEMLVWYHSSCRAERFQQLALKFFGHTEHTHQLITPREHAYTELGLRPGDRVQFRFDGQHYQGFINRITRRATVLVEDAGGVPYSDGRRYQKFYVPLSQLERQD
jgi:hypothetical protein